MAAGKGLRKPEPGEEFFDIDELGENDFPEERERDREASPKEVQVYMQEQGGFDTTEEVVEVLRNEA